MSTRALTLVCLAAAGTALAGQPARPARFDLTVDSIMRGPGLVGHPPTELRWSGDSRELRKDNWELAVYPVENRGFEHETSWAGEYRRLLKLFETRLRGRSGGTTH